MDVGYSAAKVDLYYPGKRGDFFKNGRPQDDAALCTEMARLAYCRPETTFAFDRNRIEQVLGGIGFQGCKFFEHPTGPNGQGSHGFLAVDSVGKVSVLSFRGTDKDDPTDLLDDANAILTDWDAGGMVHRGFAGALKQIWDQVAEALSAVADYKLLFTGHSLGAAMATLAASLHLPSALYTIGSPRVGDADFVASLEGKRLGNYRFVDCCDLVTTLPPELIGYRHVGKPYYIDLARNIRQRDPDDPYIATDQWKAEIEYAEKYALRAGNETFRKLADHAPVNYVWPVTAAAGRYD